MALVVFAASATVGACSSRQGPSSTEALVEDDGADYYDERLEPPRAPRAPLPVASRPEPEAPTVVGEASGPARLVLETAEAMHEESAVVLGSCYDYVSAVYDRAGFGGRRGRETVFQGPRGGPYADPDLISPGDWLYIVAYPEARPVGTHSVLFVRWEDRDAGEALVFSYVGGRANRSADLYPRDVSRTYTILRPRERR